MRIRAELPLSVLIRIKTSGSDSRGREREGLESSAKGENPWGTSSDVSHLRTMEEEEGSARAPYLSA